VLLPKECRGICIWAKNVPSELEAYQLVPVRCAVCLFARINSEVEQCLTTAQQRPTSLLQERHTAQVIQHGPGYPTCNTDSGACSADALTGHRRAAVGAECRSGSKKGPGQAWEQSMRCPRTAVLWAAAPPPPPPPFYRSVLNTHEWSVLNAPLRPEREACSRQCGVSPGMCSVGMERRVPRPRYVGLIYCERVKKDAEVHSFPFLPRFAQPSH
jgi:hypothetical protein